MKWLFYLVVAAANFSGVLAEGTNVRHVSTTESMHRTDLPEVDTPMSGLAQHRLRRGLSKTKKEWLRGKGHKKSKGASKKEAKSKHGKASKKSKGKAYKKSTGKASKKSKEKGSKKGKGKASKKGGKADKKKDKKASKGSKKSEKKKKSARVHKKAKLTLKDKKKEKEYKKDQRDKKTVGKEDKQKRKDNANAAGAPFALRVLHINDHHSHVSAETFGLDLSDSSSMLETLADVGDLDVVYGGYPMLVAIMDELREEAMDKAGVRPLLLHGGDAITGTSFYTLFNGLVDAEMMHQVCFDAFVLGNHEFDNGDQGLYEFLVELKNSDTCSTPVVAANVIPGPESPLVELVEDGTMVASVTVEIGGRKVGLIGVDIQQKTLQSSSPDPGTTLTNEREAVIANVAELEADGVDIIVVLSHIGYPRDQVELATIPGVDIVVGGDTHTLLGVLDPVGLGVSHGPYPTTVTKDDGTTTCVVQAWEYAHLVGDLVLIFDDNGDVLRCEGKPIVPFDAAATQATNDLTDEQIAELVGILEQDGNFRSVVPDAVTADILADFEDKVDLLKQTVVGTVPEGICLERIPGYGRSLICDVCESADQGGGVCNVVAKAFLLETPTADVAINNAGGCRADIESGNFTYDDAFTVLPFSNTIVQLTMTGEEIKSVLEEALEFAYDPEGSSGSYPYASGIRYDVDETEEFGNRISNLEVNPRLEGEFVPIDMTTQYNVATNSFIAAGRDGYDTFGTIPDELVLDTFAEYAQIFVDYVRDVGTLLEPPLSEFSTQSYTTDNPVDCSDFDP